MEKEAFEINMLSALCGSRVCMSLYFNFWTKLPISSKFRVNFIMVKDALRRHFLFPEISNNNARD
jgi:hypothetical protein